MSENPILMGRTNDAGDKETILKSENEKRVLHIRNEGSGSGIYVDAKSGTVFYAKATSEEGKNYGVYGHINSGEPGGAGVLGISAARSGGGSGVRGSAVSPTGTGVFGHASSPTGKACGVRGDTNSPNGYGLYGRTNSPNGLALRTDGRSRFGGDVIPSEDNNFDLGSSNNRWRTVYARGGVVELSLSKFKENIEPPHDIDYLSSVPEPIYFNWRNDDDKTRHLGFLGDHLPNITKDGDGGVYISSVLSILCGAIKQLTEENMQVRETYKSTIHQLEKRIEQLERRI